MAESNKKITMIGLKGPKGDNGLSAYEIAVNNGFVGTESEWLESIKGETGIKDYVNGLIPQVDETHNGMVIGIIDGKMAPVQASSSTAYSKVIFMSEDGSEELAAITVLNGVNAVFPLDDPTKEETASSTYKFDGWSLTPGGSLAASALNNVVSNIVVYAHFTEELKSFTVKFYNDTNLLYTTTVQYSKNATYVGDTPVDPNSSKEFVGWNPAPSNITEDLNCYAQFADISGLQSMSWDDISAVSSGGNAANYFSVGDCKTVHLSGTCKGLALDTDLCVYIIGFDHNSELEGTGIHFGTFKTAAVDGVDVSIYSETMNSTNATYGGWKACDMRYGVLGSTDNQPTEYGGGKTTSSVGYDPSSTCATNPVADTIMACLPADLRAVMKPMIKYAANVVGGTLIESKIEKTIDYLPLLAEFEVFGEIRYANDYEKNYQAQYEYYANGNSKIKYKHNSTTSAGSWWERSLISATNDFFCHVTSNGYPNYNAANNSEGVAPVFKV